LDVLSRQVDFDLSRIRDFYISHKYTDIIPPSARVRVLRRSFLNVFCSSMREASGGELACRRVLQSLWILQVVLIREMVRNRFKTHSFGCDFQERLVYGLESIGRENRENVEIIAAVFP